mgnify:CR=1 FL=1
MQRLCVDRDAQPLAAGQEPPFVETEERDALLTEAHRLEEAVAVREAAVERAEQPALRTVHPDERVGRCELHRRRRQTRRKTTEPLVPPKPNELDSATSMFRSCATFGT